MRSRLLSVMLSFVGCLFAQTPAVEEPTMVVEGRIVDMRGDGVPVASVRIVEVEDETKVLVRTTTDGEGFFRLAKVPTERLVLRADATGYCIGAHYVGPERSSVTVSLQQAVAVRGVLTNRRGDPVPDVVVRAAPAGRSLRGMTCDGRTDRDGRFELPAVPLAAVQFSAWVPGEGLAELVQHIAAQCEIALQPNQSAVTSLHVTIEGLPADAPLVRLDLMPYRNTRLTYFPPPNDRPQFDAQGQWQLENAPDWGYSLRPTSTAFAFAPRLLQVGAGQGPHSVKFAATPIAASLACRAVARERSGKAVAGLRLRMRGPDGAAEAFATSDADGRATFSSHLIGGTEAVISATGESWVMDQDKEPTRLVDRGRDMRHEFTVDPNKVLELRVVPACGVHGRVLLGDGRPAPFVDVELQANIADLGWRAMARTRTGRDGVFRLVGLHHLVEAVRVHIEAHDGSFDCDPFQIAEPSTLRDLGSLQLRTPATIEGMVLDANQQPVPGIRVWLVHSSVVETLSDRDGRYRFLGVPIGDARVQWLPNATDDRPPTRGHGPFAVEAGKTYTFDLQAPGK